jgi:hypothetical protein
MCRSINTQVPHGTLLTAAAGCISKTSGFNTLVAVVETTNIGRMLAYLLILFLVGGMVFK